MIEPGRGSLGKVSWKASWRKRGSAAGIVFRWRGWREGRAGTEGARLGLTGRGRRRPMNKSMLRRRHPTAREASRQQG